MAVVVLLQLLQLGQDVWLGLKMLLWFHKRLWTCVLSILVVAISDIFDVFSFQGDVLSTKYQVDLGDGFKAIYVNLTMTGEPIRHRYENPGVYRVSVRAENVAGHDEAVVFVQVNCKSALWISHFHHC